MVAPARPNALTMSTRCPAQVKRTAVISTWERSAGQRTRNGSWTATSAAASCDDDRRRPRPGRGAAGRRRRTPRRRSAAGSAISRYVPLIVSPSGRRIAHREDDVRGGHPDSREGEDASAGGPPRDREKARARATPRARARTGRCRRRICRGSLRHDRRTGAVPPGRAAAGCPTSAPSRPTSRRRGAGRARCGRAA